MLWLTSCRLDTTVSLDMEEDGTGTVTVTATADAELVAKVPDLAEELELGDAVAAGWDVSGPEATEDGGLTITLRHPFRDADEATSLLSSLGGPFASMAVTRIIEGTGVEASATNSLGGTFVLRRGWAGFADQQLIEAVGGTPFADRIGDATPEESVSATFAATLPGRVTRSNGEGDDGAVRWDVPLDGTEQAVELQTVQEPAEGNDWAQPLKIGALIALAVWLVLSLAFIAYVLVARRRRGSLHRR
jgi:hypothetical protein